ncbi:hypothetical protein GQ54DRAFT_299405 [Martensiomyces pterosporus]|nr:hypothetical protein GQ54DRAFT_299405 [Martensiomyces pterosporus]
MLRSHLVNTYEEQRQARDTLSKAGVSLAGRKNKLIFMSWHRRYGRFTESYTRMRRAMLKLEEWAGENCPPLLHSLSPGLGWMGGESIPVRELLSVVSDSPAMRDFLMAYHLHDGQRRVERFLGFGLFGSYECYGEFCSLSWLPSRMLQVVEMGRFSILIFAWCSVSKNYLGVVVGCPEAHADHIMHHVIQLQPGSHRFVDKGLFGMFFQTYIDDLAAGHYDVYNGLVSMMPNCGPNTSTSFTRGIRTTVSALFCPDETPEYRVYRYQVTFQLVDPEELGYPSVQLKSRSWLAHYENSQYTQSNGAGVVGEFPTISEKRPYFRYCSRIVDEIEGLLLVGFEGGFTMVPGTLDSPLGREFTLPVPYLEVPIPLEIL